MRTKFDDCSVMHGYISELYMATGLYDIAGDAKLHYAISKLNFPIQIDVYAISILSLIKVFEIPKAKISMNDCDERLVLNFFSGKKEYRNFHSLHEVI